MNNTTDLTGYLKCLVQNLYVDVEKAFYGHFKFSKSDILDEDQLERLFNHFISNCNDVGLPQVPINLRNLYIYVI